jgi:hypothetical protein
MTERSQNDPRYPGSGSPLPISRALIAALVLAVAATGALVVTILTGMPRPVPPPSAPGTMPPPPPDERPIVVFVVVTGFFVLAWLAALIVYSRDQVLARLRQRGSEPVREDVAGLLAGLRAELAADREAELASLGDLIKDVTAEYGERRETDGYLNGMRTAAVAQPPEANVRPLRRNPPPRL